MTPADPRDDADADDAVAEWLAACDDELLAGRPPTLPPDPDGRADGDLAWLVWVRESWPNDGVDPVGDTVPVGKPVDRPADASPPAVLPGASEFVFRLDQSGLLDAATLAMAREHAAAGATARQVADGLVAAGRLTPFQVDGLMSGRSRLLIAGRYAVEDRLGAGGMGSVFRCRHTVMRHTVAVKLIAPDLAREPETVARFRREARAAAALSHPNIVRALEMDEDRGEPFLVMEYVPGETLAALVARAGPLPPDVARNYAAQAAAGLAHAHAAGLVHRDVKPANLLLDEAGVVKVLDLGLARFAAETDDADGLTRQNAAMLGTVDFLAPEQAMDSHAADARSDVYSLGATLYFLLAGQAPFAGRNTTEKLVAHQVKEPPSIPGLSPALAAVLARMMAKDPAARFASMNEVIAALADPEQIPPPPPPRASRRGVLVLGGAAVVATAAAAVAGWRATRPTPPPPTTTPDPPPPPPTRPAPSEDDRWVDETVRLPADRQLERVVARLRADNPGYDGSVAESTAERDKIVGLALPVQHVANLRAVRGLGRLRSLNLKSTPDQPGIVADLRPLVNLPLTELRFPRNPVTDLAPLAGLTGLTVLSAQNCPIFDLGPLRTLPLADLDLIGVTATDLGPLRGKATLRKLALGGSRLKDIGPLKGLPLTLLIVQFCPVAGLDPLRDMPLAELRVPGTEVEDLGPLKGMKLETLALTRTRVTDLSPLAGMPLRTIDLMGTKVSDLAPLRGCPLKAVHLSGSKVADLSPIAGPGLVSVYAPGIPATDLSPLLKCPLRFLTFDLVPARDFPILRKLKTLQRINDQPAADVLGG